LGEGKNEMNKHSGKNPTGKSREAAPPEKVAEKVARVPEDFKEIRIPDDYKKFQVVDAHRETRTETRKDAKSSPAYKDASPEDIAADIERTRAHMDETLSKLGRRIRPRLPGRQAGIALGVLAAGLLAFLGYRRVTGSRKRGRSDRSPRWRNARVLEQVMLAKNLAMAARKGKPAIIVVEPRKI
jgi:Protein of unknown function (DUF3618)